MGLRIQFDDKATDKITFIRTALGLSDNTDVVKLGLALLSVATDAQLRGEELVIVSADGERETPVRLV